MAEFVELRDHLTDSIQDIIFVLAIECVRKVQVNDHIVGWHVRNETSCCMNGSFRATRYPDSQLKGAEIISEDVGGMSAGTLGSKASPKVADNDGPNAAGFLIDLSIAVRRSPNRSLAMVLWAPATDEDIQERRVLRRRAPASYECVNSTRS